MKKSAWVAIGVLVVLVGVFLAIRETPEKTVKAPMTIPAVAGMNRVEIVPPGDDGELVVLEKTEDTWRMTRPVESALSQRAQDKLGKLFAKKVRTDDIDLASAKAAELAIDDASAVKVSAYGEAGDSPALELLVGEEVTIPETRVRRTYVRKPGKDKIYRAQMALGDFVRTPPSGLRSKTIAQLDTDKISAVTIARSADGAERPATTLHLEKAKDDWTMTQPQAPGELDKVKVHALLRALSHLRAAGFADDAKPAEVGLQPAKTKVTIQTGQSAHTLRIGEPTDDQKVYVRFDDGDIFTVRKSTVDRLAPSAGELVKQQDESVKKQEKAKKTAQK